MDTQISFLEGTLSLIHIPLDLYPYLLQPILQVLLPPSQDRGQHAAEGAAGGSHDHEFLNISVTPIECSIVCNSAWAESVFHPAIRRLPREQAKMVAISSDTYAALNVYGTGMDAGSRVADLTSPLALANIPIFFITTYYSDFILVPVKHRQAVIKAFLAQGVVFSDDNQPQLASADSSPTARGPRQGFHDSRDSAPSSDNNSNPSSVNQAPPSPPLSSVNDLQQRTFDLLRRRNVTPHIDPSLTLVQCTGIDGAGVYTQPSRPAPSWVDTVDARLYTSVVAALAAGPRFLSVTLARGDAPSLLLDRALLPMFGDSLAGPAEGALAPIFLDLADLPFEATGIVSGVAGRLVREMRMADGAELSYLSTARAGAVILSREQARVALGVLEAVLRGGGGDCGLQRA